MNKLMIRYSPVDCDKIELVSPNLLGGLALVSKIRNNRISKFYYNWNNLDDYFKFRQDFPLRFERFNDGEHITIYYNDIEVFRFEPKDHIITFTKTRCNFSVEFIDEIELF